MYENYFAKPINKFAKNRKEQFEGKGKNHE